MRKYIIVKDDEGRYVMRFANVDFHFNLVEKTDKRIFGGGMYTDNDETKEMLLWGRSSDYGEPKFGEVTGKIHTDSDLEGYKIILGNIYPSLEENRTDITSKFIFDE